MDPYLFDQEPTISSASAGITSNAATRAHILGTNTCRALVFKACLLSTLAVKCASVAVNATAKCALTRATTLYVVEIILWASLEFGMKHCSSRLNCNVVKIF